MEKKYGWEDNVEEIWLSYLNKKVLESGLITQDEYVKIEAEIIKRRLGKEQ